MSLLDDDVVTSIESWPVIAWCLIDAGSYIWTIPVTANDDVNQIHVEGPYPWALLDVEGGIYTFRSGQRLPKDKDDNSAVRERLQAQLRRMRGERRQMTSLPKPPNWRDPPNGRSSIERWQNGKRMPAACLGRDFGAGAVVANDLLQAHLAGLDASDASEVTDKKSSIYCH